MELRCPLLRLQGDRQISDQFQYIHSLKATGTCEAVYCLISSDTILSIEPTSYTWTVCEEKDENKRVDESIICD